MSIPEFLGPYRIGQSIGKGGMGSVYKAKQIKTDELVAVKLIATQVSDDMRFRRRFHSEVETLKMLRHPNIIRLLGYGEEQGMLFYSMEYVEGETLQQRIRSAKRLPWREAVRYAIQISSALNHAHYIGVTHRDLKPANLIIGGDQQIKLVDFGISKIFGNDQTAEGSILGTADYMAPEQVDQSSITSKTDLYSLGSVVYAMLAGRPPFRGKNLTEVLTALVSKEPAMLDLVDPELPSDLVQLVDELLKKSPADRPPTALAVMNRFQAILDSDGESSQPHPFLLGNLPDAPEPSPHTSKGNVSKHGDPYSTEATDATVAWSQSDQTGSTDFSIADPEALTRYTAGPEVKHKTIKQKAIQRSATEHSQPVGGGLSGDTNYEPGNTHFQTVVEEASQVKGAQRGDADQPHPFWNVVSVVALVGLLLGCGYFVWLTAQPTTADQLLDEINLALEADRDPKRETLNDFLTRFPDRPEASMVSDLLVDARITGVEKRLTLKAKLRSGEQPLVEEAYLQALAVRRQQPQEAKRKLEQWLAIFETQVDPKDAELGDLPQIAKIAIARFQRRIDLALKESIDPGQQDPRVLSLMERIDEAATLPEEARQARLQSVLDSFGDQDWAEPAVTRAEKLMRESP